MALQGGGCSAIMDITVSRLNERMALRVPSELPLGLVFIVGQVEAIRPYPQAPGEVALQLIDDDHSLPCRLPQQVAEEMQLAGKERVRAGGHLRFDTREARYYLLARDIEVLPPPVREDEEDVVEAPLPRTDAAPVQEQSDDGRLVTAELPPWVQQLAPPELQSELGLPAAAAETAVPNDDELRPLPDALVDYLSQAIDSDQEIELTPSLVHRLLEQYKVASPDGGLVEVEHFDDEMAEVVEESALAGGAAQEAPIFPAYTEWPAHPDDGSVPESGLPAGATDQPSVELSGGQKRKESPPQRQTLLLIAGVFGLFLLILLVFVVIALAAGYTPSLLP